MAENWGIFNVVIIYNMCYDILVSLTKEKSMNRLLLLVVLLITNSITYADSKTGWYIGVGAGSSSLEFDTQTEIDKATKKGGYDIYLEGLSQLGYNPVLVEDFSSSAQSLIVGYRFSQRWSVEIQRSTLGSFSAKDSIHVYETGSFNIHTPEGDITGSGHITGDAVADASLTKLRLVSVSALYTITDRQIVEPYFRLGVGYLQGTLNTHTRYSYEATGVVQAGESTASDTISDVSEEYKTKAYGSPVGVGGVGLRFNLGKSTEMRVEYQRIGFVFKDPNISTCTVQLIQLF